MSLTVKAGFTKKTQNYKVSIGKNTQIICQTSDDDDDGETRIT